MTPKQALFVQEYLVDLNAKQAAIRAGYSVKRAEITGCELVSNRRVSAAIEAAKAARIERTQITADEVVRDLAVIAQADPRELVEYRRGCCRFCWGEGNRWQRTPAELARDRKMHALMTVSEDDPPPFDMQGGGGFNGKKPPNPECPECFGDGVGTTLVKDSRTLSPRAARLFAGIKTTKDGLEVRMLSQDDALVNLGRHLGVFEKDNKQRNPLGDGPVTIRIVAVRGRDLA